MKAALSSVQTVAAASFIAAGASLGDFVARGLDEAGKFELAMKNVAIATGATGDTLKGFQNMAIDLSGKTSQNATQIAQEIAMAASAGLSNAQLKVMGPQIAAYADVQMRAHGTDPVDAVSEAVQAAHLTRSYGNNETTFRGKKTTDLGAMLEFMNELSFSQPENMKRVVTQMGYFAPQGKALGLNLDNIMDTLTVMGQTGYLKGKGGAAFAQLLNGAINTVAVTAHKQSAKTEALMGLGVVDRTGKPIYVNSKGQLNWTAFSAHMRKMEENTNHAKLHAMLQAGFGVNGGRFADIAFNPDTEKQRLATRHKMDTMIPDIATEQKEYLALYNVAWNTLKTNTTNAIIGLFTPLMTQLTPYINELAASVSNFAQYFMSNPDLGLKVSLGLITGSVALVGAGTTMLVRQFLTLAGSINVLAASARAASAANAVSAGVNDAAAAGDAMGVPAIIAGGAGKSGLWAGIKRLLTPILDGTLLAKAFTPTGFGAAFGKGFAGDMFAGIANSLKIIATPLTFVAGLFVDIGTVVAGIVAGSAGLVLFFAALAAGVAWVATHPFDFGKLLYNFDVGLRKGLAIVFDGIGNALKAALSATMNGIGLLVGMIAGIVTAVINAVRNPAAAGGAAVDWMKTTGGSIEDWYRQLHAAANGFANPVVPLSTKGYSTGGPAAPGQPLGPSIGTLNINVTEAKDSKKTAEAVMKHITKTATFHKRASGGTRNTPYIGGFAGAKI